MATKCSLMNAIVSAALYEVSSITWHQWHQTAAEGREATYTRIEQAGVRIVVDPMSAMYIKGSEIDFVDALMGGGFALRNPNAVSSCGCGQSFKTADQAGTAKACSH